MNLEGTWCGRDMMTGSRDASLLGKEKQVCLHVQKHRIGKFSGTIQEEGEIAIPGMGYVEGQCWRSRITFVKQMPVFYTAVEGKGMPLTEAAPLLFGTTLREELVHPNLHYEGRWNEATGCFSGTWHIEPVYVTFLNGRRVLFGASEGTWYLTKCAEKDLLRASEEPLQEQQATLLRAAAEGMERCEEQLVRAVEGAE